MSKQSHRVSHAGKFGLVSDYPYLDLPKEAWNSAQNIRVNDGEISAFPGHDLGAENTGLADLWALYTVTGDLSHYWVQRGVDSLGNIETYAFDGTLQHDLTGPALTSARSDIVTPCFLNGYLIINDGAGVPQTWDLNTSNNLVALTGWDAGWKARAMESFKGFLIAINITDSSTRRPSRVKWSAEAAPGALPSSWDALDPTISAGERDLADTTADLVALKPLRDEMMLYTAREAIGMQLVGGSNIWRFRPLSDQGGAISPRAVSRFKSSHVVLTDSDVVVNDGQSLSTIIDQRNRKLLFNQLDESNYGFAFLQEHRLQNEVWVCFPTAGNDFCDLALVWNWVEDTWGVRELPVGCITAATGLDIVGVAADLWSTDTGTWGESFDKWDERTFNQLGGVLLLGGDNSPAGLTGAPIFRADKTGSFNGAGKVSRIERLGIAPDPQERMLTITEVWPRAYGDPFIVRIGHQDDPNGAVQWQVSKVFDPECDKKVTCRIKGRYPCIAFESYGSESWRLHGYRMVYRAGASR